MASCPAWTAENPEDYPQVLDADQAATDKETYETMREMFFLENPTLVTTTRLFARIRDMYCSEVRIQTWEHADNSDSENTKDTVTCMKHYNSWAESEEADGKTTDPMVYYGVFHEGRFKTMGERTSISNHMPRAQFEKLSEQERLDLYAKRRKRQQSRELICVFKVLQA